MARYLKLWETHLPQIFYRSDVAFFTGKQQEIHLTEEEFTEIGKRIVSGYSFRIVMIKGSVVNNVSGSQVARDLVRLLTSTAHLRKWLQNRTLEISLNSKFILLIK